MSKEQYEKRSFAATATMNNDVIHIEKMRGSDWVSIQSRTGGGEVEITVRSLEMVRTLILFLQQTIGEE